MKAIAVCEKCGKKLATECDACIEAKTDLHKCKNMKEADVVHNIKWKVLGK